MIFIFWVAMISLYIIACGFVVFYLQSLRDSLVVIAIFGVSAFGLYCYWGESQQLPLYYSKGQQEFRQRLPELQYLFSEFKKEEYRLRFRLEENSNDKEAKWRLFDILAIKALNEGNPKLAKEYWIKAIEDIPKEQSSFKHEIQERIIKLESKNLESK